MKKSEYKYDDIEEWLDDLISLGLDILDILIKQKRQQYFTQGRLFIADTFEYHFSSLDINDKIDVLYEANKELYNNATYKFRGWLNHQEIQSIILESIWEVLQVHPLKSYDEYTNIILSYIHNKCCNLVDYKKASKRGGEATHTSLDKEEAIEIGIDDVNFNTAEMNIWLEMNKTRFTTNEYKYLYLIINDSFLALKSNVVIAEVLGVTEKTIRDIKKSLKTKIDINEL